MTNELKEENRKLRLQLYEIANKLTQAINLLEEISVSKTHSDSIETQLKDFLKVYRDE